MIRNKTIAISLIMAFAMNIHAGAFAESRNDASLNPSLEKVFSGFSNSLESKKDRNRLKKFNEEVKKGKNKISNETKDQMIEDQISSQNSESISNDLDSKVNDQKAKKQILKQLLGSIKKTEKGKYRLFIKSSLPYDQLSETLSFFDEVNLKPITVAEDGKASYELDFSLNGRLGKYLGSKLDAGEIPTSIFDGIETVKPVYVQNLISTGTYLGGESLNNLWGMKAIGATDYQYGLSQKNKIKIGIIDTGIASSHSDLAANIGAGGYNFVSSNTLTNDDNGHGSHVSGIAGGIVNSSGVFGVDSNASLVPLKVLDSSGYGSSYDIVDAINYAASNGIKVLNMSLGGSGNPSYDIICSAITSAKNKGTITVVAAGNSNTDVSTTVPAGCTDSITVGAVDQYLKKASFSNYGSKVDVSAPGVNIYSSYPTNTYSFLNGTSMAAPFVTGLVASMLAYNPNLNTDQIKSILKDPNNSLSVNSNVNIGRLISMPKVMSYLGVQNDSAGDAASPGSGSGAITYLPVLNVAASEISTNTYNIKANATETGGTIVWYGYYNGSNLITSGTLNNINVSIITNTTITVKAKDANGNVVSKDVTLTYKQPANQSPVLNLSYVGMSSNNRLTINTYDNDGKIAKVDIYVNGDYRYYSYPNLQNYTGYLYFTKGKTYTVKVVSKDNLGVSTEKTIIVK